MGPAIFYHDTILVKGISFVDSRMKTITILIEVVPFALDLFPVQNRFIILVKNASGDFLGTTLLFCLSSCTSTFGSTSDLEFSQHSILSFLLWQLLP